MNHLFDICLTVSQWLSLDWFFYPVAIFLGFFLGVYFTKTLRNDGGSNGSV